MSDSSPKSDPNEAAYAEGVRLQRSGAYAEAAALYEPLTKQVLTLNLAVNLGICLRETGRLEEAQRWLSAAASQRPNVAAVRLQMGNLFAEMGRTAEAEGEFRAALALEPGSLPAQAALAGLLMSLGRYAEGWPLMEARIALNPDVVPPIQVGFPEWKGEPLDGRSILVWYEQGLGDQIQFVRFAQDLKARGAAHVAVGCRPALAELFRTAAGVDEVIAAPRGGNVTVRTYDFWSRYLSVPVHLGTTLETLPTRPYLFASDDRRARWAGWSGVGLVWRASPTGFNVRNKNVPDALARRLLDLGAKSLHPEETGAQDFADTAAIVEQLDLVVSIDTSVAHLAGAMGKPVWTLIPRLHADWRWLRGRTDSPWYPTMRLYRQQTPFDWTEVIEAVARDLRTSG